jgi:hypothetical protein
MKYLLFATALFLTGCGYLSAVRMQHREDIALGYIADHPTFLDSLCTTKFSSVKDSKSLPVLDSTRLPSYYAAIDQDSLALLNIHLSDSGRCPMRQLTDTIIKIQRSLPLFPTLVYDTVNNPRQKALIDQLKGDNQTLSLTVTTLTAQYQSLTKSSDHKTYWIIGLAFLILVGLIYQVAKILKYV